MVRQARFAVLQHLSSPDGDHFDFLIEKGPTADLETWRLPAWPIFGSHGCLKLRDHRRAYLTDQGPVSNDRGSVIRVAEGTAEIKLVGITTLITGPNFRLELSKIEGTEDEWLVRG